MDQATFKKAYGYDSKPMEEQVLLNAIWKKLVDDGKISSIKPSTSTVSTSTTKPITTSSTPSKVDTTNKIVVSGTNLTIDKARSDQISANITE